MKICFVDSSKKIYSHENFNDEYIRGAENILINFSQKLHNLKNSIYIFNNCIKEIDLKNYKWLHLNKIENFKNTFDVVISNNDTTILNKFNCKKKFVISHSILTIEKSIRKKQLLSYFRNKPVYLLLGKYHQNKMSKIFSLYKTKNISYGVDELYEKKEIIDSSIDTKLSFFTSRQDRNLELLIDVWKSKISVLNENYKLYITPIKQDLRKYNIFNRKMLKKNHYIENLSKARMIILPGHKAELFCLSALEASELCIPIVTMGIGSLAERVEHGVTGLIAKNEKEFSSYITELFKNNELWLKLRQNLIQKRGENSWTNATNKFLEIITNN